MPVQIDEVVITTNVSLQDSRSLGDAAATSDVTADPWERERELAEKILQIIREKTER